jgi:hypothetical protein
MTPMITAETILLFLIAIPRRSSAFSVGTLRRLIHHPTVAPDTTNASFLRGARKGSAPGRLGCRETTDRTLTMGQGVAEVAQEHRRRGDAADALFRELNRRAAEPDAWVALPEVSSASQGHRPWTQSQR